MRGYLIWIMFRAFLPISFMSSTVLMSATVDKPTSIREYLNDYSNRNEEQFIELLSKTKPRHLTIEDFKALTNLIEGDHPWNSMQARIVALDWVKAQFENKKTEKNLGLPRNARDPQIDTLTMQLSLHKAFYKNGENNNLKIKAALLLVRMFKEKDEALLKFIETERVHSPISSELADEIDTALKYLPKKQQLRLPFFECTQTLKGINSN